MRRLPGSGIDEFDDRPGSSTIRAAKRRTDVNTLSSSARRTGIGDRRRTEARLQGNIIPLLQEIQEEFGYLSEEQIDGVAEKVGVSASVVYGVATFYSQFRLRAPGRHMIRVCEGTACHVLGAGAVLEALKMELGIDVGGTTADGLFSLESVRCLGCCSLAPAVVIDEETYGRVSANKIGKILAPYRKKEPR
jgi:NADH-quinone oxidoreductase subunit E